MKIRILILIFTLLASGCGGGRSSQEAPQAKAAPHLSISTSAPVYTNFGETVELNSDIQSSSEWTVGWTQIAGPHVDLQNSNTAAPFFVTPALKDDATVEFLATVENNDGKKQASTVQILARKPPSLSIWPTTVPAGGLVKWEIALKVADTPILAGGGVKIRFHKGFFPSKPQSTDKDAPGYTSVSVENPAVEIAISKIEHIDQDVDWDIDRGSHVVTAELISGQLTKDETITVSFGTSPAIDRVSKHAFSAPVYVALRHNEKQPYRNHPFPIAVKIVPSEASALIATIESIGQVNKSARLRVSALDKHGNIAKSYTGNITIKSDSIASIPAESIQISEGDNGTASTNITFTEAGRGFVHAIDYENNLSVTTNPILVKENETLLIYWGDLHSHTMASVDGMGSGSFEYARDASHLDFYAATDHTSSDQNDSSGGLNPEEWQHQKSETRAFYKEGSFVTFPGYEFSAGEPSGHHNFIFNVNPPASLDDVPIFRRNEHHSIHHLWDIGLPAGIDALIIPHHTGMLWSPNSEIGPLVHFGSKWESPERRRHIEIYSKHGQSEHYAPNHPLSYSNIKNATQRGNSSGPHYFQNALALGEKLGAIASSDDHSAKPGQNSYGLTAVYATALSRNPVFDALKSKTTYATTGERIILDFSINNHPMGSTISPPGETPLHAHIDVTGTDNIEIVELLGWSGEFQGNHPRFEAVQSFRSPGNYLKASIDLPEAKHNSIYYVRVKQVNKVNNREVYAWSSPIFIEYGKN